MLVMVGKRKRKSLMVVLVDDSLEKWGCLGGCRRRESETTNLLSWSLYETERSASADWLERLAFTRSVGVGRVQLAELRSCRGRKRRWSVVGDGVATACFGRGGDRRCKGSFGDVSWTLYCGLLFHGSVTSGLIGEVVRGVKLKFRFRFIISLCRQSRR